jgi:hypothetical protein
MKRLKEEQEKAEREKSERISLSLQHDLEHSSPEALRSATPDRDFVLAKARER